MILKRLRQETSKFHTALEARLPLMSPELTLEAYRWLLEKFWGYYEPLETRILSDSQLGAIGIDYQNRLKFPSLEQDLTDLNDRSFASENLPRCRVIPEMRSVPEKLGCLYVIEGATLGGQIISRHLASQLGLSATNGGRFFSGYGAETGMRWQAFGATLSAAAEELNQDDAIVSAANETFKTLGDWLFEKPWY